MLTKINPLIQTNKMIIAYKSLKYGVSTVTTQSSIQAGTINSNIFQGELPNDLGRATSHWTFQYLQ